MGLPNKIFYYFIWIISRTIFKFFTRLKARGLDTLSFKKPLIITANHLSLIDAFVVAVSFPLSSGIHPIGFMVHDGWMKSIFGIFIKWVGGFPAYVGQGLEKSLKIPRNIIKNKGVILIFPRGSRKKRFHKKKSKIGAAVLALESNTPILPVKISDSHPGDFKKFFLRKRKIRITIGQPFYLSEKIGKKKDYDINDFLKGAQAIACEISCLN